MTIDRVSIDDLGSACSGLFGLLKDTCGQTVMVSDMARKIKAQRTPCSTPIYRVVHEKNERFHALLLL